MKILNYVFSDEINEFKAIIDSKHLATRSRLKLLTARIESDYDFYIKNFDKVASLSSSAYNVIENTDLKNCYEISTKPLRALKAKIINSQIDEFKYTCPYCLIVNYSTFDHYLPKEDFPMFSVMPKNLVQSCDTCNKKKLTYWRKNSKRAIIHFYNDADINIFKFLSCNLTYKNTVPVITFYLNFDKFIPSDKRFIIENHFRRLELLERYSLNSPSIISDINIDINAQKSAGAFNKSLLKPVLLAKAAGYKAVYGINYWKALVYEILSSSNTFLSSF